MTITNTNTVVAMSATGFTDTYPAGMLNAAAATATITPALGCTGGTATATAGTNSLVVSGLTIAPSGTCTITVTSVTSTEIGRAHV